LVRRPVFSLSIDGKVLILAHTKAATGRHGSAGHSIPTFSKTCYNPDLTHQADRLTLVIMQRRAWLYTPRRVLYFSTFTHIDKYLYLIYNSLMDAPRHLCTHRLEALIEPDSLMLQT
jgi:hypothetical protein